MHIRLPPLRLRASPEPQNPIGIYLLVLLPILALGAGKLINLSFVPGSYEWWGLVRICGELFERSGFWCIAFGIWAIGINNSADSISWAHLLRKKHFQLTWAGGAAVFGCLAALFNTIEIAGTLADFAALILLLSGWIAVDLCRAKNYRSGAWSICRYFLVGIAIFAGYTAVGYFHTMVKGALFIFAPSQDGLLWTVDAIILGDNHYHALAEWRPANPHFVHWLDVVYIGLLQQICWSALFFHGARDFVNGRQYLLAMFLINTLGSLGYFMAPSIGPIFYAPELFVDLRFLAPDTWELSKFLLSNTNAAIHGASQEIAPFGYIAALPSLHVGQAVIMLLAMRRSFIAVAFNFSLLTFTITATNILGWHYIVDAIAGLALGALMWWIASMSCEQRNQV